LHPTKFGVGVLENKEHNHEKYTQKMVYIKNKIKKNEKGTNNEKSE